MVISQFWPWTNRVIEIEGANIHRTKDWETGERMAASKPEFGKRYKTPRASSTASDASKHEMVTRLSDQLLCFAGKGSVSLEARSRRRTLGKDSRKYIARTSARSRAHARVAVRPSWKTLESTSVSPTPLRCSIRRARMMSTPR